MLGCTEEEEIELLSSLSNIEIDFTLDPSTCEGNIGQINIFEITGAVGDFSIFLYDSPLPISNVNFPIEFALIGGDHDIFIVDDSGCVHTESFTIISIDPRDLFLDDLEDETIESGQSVALNPTGNFLVESAIWSPAAGLSCTECINPIASPLNTTRYRVEAFDVQGCSVFSNVNVIVEKNQSFYIPNAFSPNEDGFNDEFIIFGNVEVARIIELSIYDRWGTQVFIMEDAPPNDLAFGWNGRFRGELLQPGVFVYHTVIEFIDGTQTTEKGDITLIR